LTEQDVFQQQVWFDHLWKCGLEGVFRAHDLQQVTPAGPVVMRLMEDRDGRVLSGLSNYYSGLFGLQGDPAAIAAWDGHAMAREISRARGGAVVKLHPLDAQAVWVSQLEAGLRRSAYWTNRYPFFANWFQPVPSGGFNVYWAARPSALRNTVARARKRLDRQERWRLEILTEEGPGLEAAIDAYVAVYDRSWKTPEPNPAFMPGLIRLAALQRWLRLGLVYVGDEPVAAQLWLVAGGKANIFKLAYVKGQEKLSAGSVLTAELMRHVMDVDGVQEVDFLSGDDPYKADWMERRRERIGLVAFDKRHWRGWLAAIRHRLGQWRRSWRQPA
jgi:hypothetical protein